MRYQLSMLRISLFEPAILRRAALDAFRKLNPRHVAKNPVMFVVEIGSAITTVAFLGQLKAAKGSDALFTGQISVWLWFTVLFANFAEAIAEGRGKAQADSLRRARAETLAKRERGGRVEEVPSSLLRAGDIVQISAGELIPSDGEIIEGIASVDESAITGESAPVIRESGGDRSGVTAGTRVLSDFIRVRITANPGETFLDRMISLVEGARRQKTPNEIALSVLLAVLTIIFLLVVVTLEPLALRGVPYRAVGAGVLLRRNLLIYGVGGIITPFIGIKIIDVIIHWLCLA